MKLIDADKLLEHIGSMINTFDKCLNKAESRRDLTAMMTYKFINDALSGISDHINDMDEEYRWISVEEAMPEEHNSVFAKLYGTDKWEESMFKKASSTVIVSVEVAGKTRYTTTASTRDGKWHNNFWGMVKKAKVIAWMHLPEPYKE